MLIKLLIGGVLAIGIAVGSFALFPFVYYVTLYMTADGSNRSRYESKAMKWLKVFLICGIPVWAIGFILFNTR
jgi:hypothetical protein